MSYHLGIDIGSSSIKAALVEIETGDAENEPATLALQKAIEEAVLQIVKIGYDKNFWEVKDEKTN